MFIIGTRVILGAGVGLLASSLLKEKQRKIVGRSLLAVGAATTFPAARWAMGR